LSQHFSHRLLLASAACRWPSSTHTLQLCPHAAALLPRAGAVGGALPERNRQRGLDGGGAGGAVGDAAPVAATCRQARGPRIRRHVSTPRTQHSRQATIRPQCPISKTVATKGNQPTGRTSASAGRQQRPTLASIADVCGGEAHLLQPVTNLILHCTGMWLVHLMGPMGPLATLLSAAKLRCWMHNTNPGRQRCSTRAGSSPHQALARVGRCFQSKTAPFGAHRAEAKDELCPYAPGLYKARAQH
jgi:hypothetical protein